LFKRRKYLKASTYNKVVKRLIYLKGLIWVPKETRFPAVLFMPLSPYRTKFIRRSTFPFAYFTKYIPWNSDAATQPVEAQEKSGV
jgi:hypothetical protein